MPLDMETIGYYLFMEEQEKQARKNRSTKQNNSTSEKERTFSNIQDKGGYFPRICPPTREEQSRRESYLCRSCDHQQVKSCRTCGGGRRTS